MAAGSSKCLGRTTTRGYRPDPHPLRKSPREFKCLNCNNMDQFVYELCLGMIVNLVIFQ